MIRLFRFSPSNLALGYIALSVLALALFAIPLWYAWSVNVSTFRDYIHGEEMQRLVDVASKEGAKGLAAAIESKVGTLPADEVIVLADASKTRLAGNLPQWPTEVPDAPGVYGLVIDLGGGSTMRLVVSHVRLPGGYHFLMGRESVRFQSLVDLFWYGIAGAMAIVLVLGAVVGWMIRRALLAEVDKISRTASAIAGGDFSRRLAPHRGSSEIDTLAQTVNGMLEQLAGKNVQLGSEIADRRQAEQALHRAHDELEELVAQRTDQLARANESMEGEKRLLEMIAKGNSLPTTLDLLCRHVEEMSGGVHCSIMLMDSNGGRMLHGAAPSLPESYIAAIDGWPLTAGPCGMAASLGEPVIASDIALDERWPDEYKTLSSAHGLSACWSTPIMSSDGKVLGTFAMLSRETGSPTPQHRNTIEQVTHIASIAIERTRAVEDLQRQKAHLDELFELAPDAIVLTDLSHPEIIRVNKEFTRVFGYTPEEAVGQRLRRLIVPGDMRPAGLAENPDLLAGKKVEKEVVRRRKDGTRFHAHVTAKRVRLQGDEDAAYLIYRDITERKEAEDKVRRSETFLADGQRISHTGSWGWVLSTGKVIWSQEQYRMLGFNPGETEPSVERFLIAVHPEDRSRVQQNLEEATREGRNYAMDFRVVLPDGSVRNMRSEGRPVVAEGGGSVEEYIGVTMDITERVHAEAALRRAQRLEAMGTLAGGIAHDFNNILGAILGYGEMALRDAPQATRLRRDLESITAAGERGRALVDRILAFSRSGVGERVAVHVEKVVRESLDLLMANLPAGVTVKAELRAGRAAMQGDATQVHQVVMNLATNGIQAMDPGGILRISLATVCLDSQRIATTGTVAAGNYILLKVADAGHGIPAGILDRIFDPFFTTKEVGVGTGLGLSLVHGIVTEVGGAIDVETTLGAGSTFTVYLPRAGDAADGSADEQPELPRGDRQRVLVVDDEEPLVRLTTETLQELGYVPVAFTSSTDALEAFRADPKRFDAVITDERMPGISGSALIREMRGIRRSIPILLVSGYVGGMVAGRAYNSGANEVLKKPLSARELATSLARVLHLQ